MKIEKGREEGCHLTFTSLSTTENVHQGSRVCWKLARSVGCGKEMDVGEERGGEEDDRGELG